MRQCIGGNRNGGWPWWNCKRNIEEIGKEQLVCQAREMCIKDKEDRVLRGCYWTQWNRDRSGKGGWDTQLARTEKCERC